MPACAFGSNAADGTFHMVWTIIWATSIPASSQGRPMVNSDRIFTTVYGFQVEKR